jgi:hypothetical protein
MSHSKEAAYLGKADELAADFENVVGEIARALN